jgi:glycerophosphoryl diester phosphodiesterase
MAGGMDLLSLNLVNAMHKRNIRVDAWTLNDIQSMQYAIDIGVDGVITDWPNILLNHVKPVISKR